MISLIKQTEHFSHKQTEEEKRNEKVGRREQ
jgi:hypothetical protein